MCICAYAQYIHGTCTYHIYMHVHVHCPFAIHRTLPPPQTNNPQTRPVIPTEFEMPGCRLGKRELPDWENTRVLSLYMKRPLATALAIAPTPALLHHHAGRSALRENTGHGHGGVDDLSTLRLLASHALHLVLGAAQFIAIQMRLYNVGLCLDESL